MMLLSCDQIMYLCGENQAEKLPESQSSQNRLVKTLMPRYTAILGPTLQS